MTKKLRNSSFVLLHTQFLNLFLERSDFDLESGFFLLRLVEGSSRLVQLRLEHGLDLRRFFAPFRLQLVQLVGQFPVLSL